MMEENSSCLQTPMTKFKLKRSGDKWFGEVTARAPCTKKQDKVVPNPNSAPKENASCSYVQNEPLDERSYMDALGGEEGMIIKPSPNLSSGIQKQKRSNAGCTKKRSNDLHLLLFSPKGLQDGTKLFIVTKERLNVRATSRGMVYSVVTAINRLVLLTLRLMLDSLLDENPTIISVLLIGAPCMILLCGCQMVDASKAAVITNVHYVE